MLIIRNKEYCCVRIIIITVIIIRVLSQHSYITFLLYPFCCVIWRCVSLYVLLHATVV